MRGTNQFRRYVFLFFWLIFAGLVSANALVEIPVVNVFASGDNAQIYQNQAGEISVLDNDYGLQNGVGRLIIAREPLHGTVVVLPNNKLLYNPNKSYVGSDELEYTVCSHEGECSTGLVTIGVFDYDFKPKATDDLLVVLSHGAQTELDILGNDTGLYDDPITVTLLSQIHNGTVQLNANNTLTPLFSQDFVGRDSLIYRVSDLEGDSDTAKVYFEVRARGDNSSMVVPNGFSPNGDGLNDVFTVPDLEGYTQMSIQVFSQWGQLVYQNSSYDNSWDGKANSGSMSGSELPTGTYYYLLVEKSTDTNITGYIYLSR